METIMGWLFQRDPVDDPVAHLMRKFTYEDDTHAVQPLAGARVGNTVYLAVRSTDKSSGRSFVLAGVILISNTKKDGFGYKDQDEVMGPTQYDCPDRIMRLLSPVADLPRAGYAAEWRAKVAARRDEQRQRRERRNSLRIGSVVTLEAAVRFPGGITASRFCVAQFRRRTPVFEALDRPGFYCCLRSATLTAAAIADPPSPPPAAAQA
jgi:hypothetical protein